MFFLKNFFPLIVLLYVLRRLRLLLFSLAFASLLWISIILCTVFNNIVPLQLVHIFVLIYYYLSHILSINWIFQFFPSVIEQFSFISIWPGATTIYYFIEFLLGSCWLIQSLLNFIVILIFFDFFYILFFVDYQ